MQGLPYQTSRWRSGTSFRPPGIRRSPCTSRTADVRWRHPRPRHPRVAAWSHACSVPPARCSNLATTARMRHRAAFVSDCHLGSAHCHAAELAQFLERLQCDRLYLIGDILDLWWMAARRTRWSAARSARQPWVQPCRRSRLRPMSDSLLRPCCDPFRYRLRGFDMQKVTDIRDDL